MPSAELIKFTIRRIINGIITLLLLILFVFILVHAAAPNPYALARIYAGNPHAPPTEIQQIIKEYGLNEPIYEQFISYITDIFRGNWGLDPIYKVPEITLLSKFLAISLQIVIPGDILAAVLGIITGAIAAANRGKAKDKTIKVVYILTWASPPFLVAFLLQLFIAYDLGLLPATGTVNVLLPDPPNYTPFPILNALIAGDWPYFISAVRHAVLPAISIAVITFGLFTRVTRASMLDALESEYTKLSLAKGLSRNYVVYRIALRNSLIPVMTLIALFFGYSVAGAVVVEDIFDYHGIGWFVTQAIESLDYIAVLDFTIIIGIAIIIANFIADLLYAVLDPRVKLG
ncbi:ABC transporter permease [Acidianus ambivalens]|uniref:ABC transporter permease subunit n=1 Tax=Acidianus ambivalens TaxID=2283 RepID=A0A650CWD0_ACIAM|nr:ABC transporter permease [Acidianus ambivalens]MQL54357.1 ABC transporter permease subunit [Acidianus ambivalens]QGR22181.1 ABC transporter permease subunit [Acidianus ambivalens]